jgi:hypothetical protein
MSLKPFSPYIRAKSERGSRKARGRRKVLLRHGADEARDGLQKRQNGRPFTQISLIGQPTQQSGGAKRHSFAGDSI